MIGKSVMRILLVKTSSMGDVINNLPVVSDLLAHSAAAGIDWVVERAFAGIAAMHGGISSTLPIAVREWRQHLTSGETWREMRTFKQRLQSESYDAVIDTQGLLKSALIARMAHGVRCGYDRSSIREPLASRFYDKTYAVSKKLHAVERNRSLVGQIVGYAPSGPADYGIRASSAVLPWLPAPYAVLLHATSAESKLWPEADWAKLGAYLSGAGSRCILPWGNAVERARADRLAASIEDAVVAPRLTLAEAASLLSGAGVVIGVDTGLTHLAAALEVPVIGIYCASDPASNGLYASRARNLGAPGRPPTAAEVIAAVESIPAA